MFFVLNDIVQLFSTDAVSEAKSSIKQYLEWYNQDRPDSSLDGQTPNEAYTGKLPLVNMAA